MTKTLLLILNEHDLNQSSISYLSQCGGISVLLRTLLSFQYSGGKSVIIIASDSESENIINEIDDLRIRLRIDLIRPNEIDKIKSLSDQDIIYLSEPSVFEQKLIHDLLSQGQNDTIQSIFIQPKITELQGKSSLIKTNIYFIPSQFIQKYNESDVTKNNFKRWINSNDINNKLLNSYFYININTKNDVKKANQGLFQFLRKPTDPFISRTLNRPVSLFLSKYLMRTPITPNMMTIVTLIISLFSVYFVLEDGYFYGVVAGVLFHLASVVDGCDGELARLKYQFTKLGELLDGAVDDFKNGLFGIALGIRIYHEALTENSSFTQFYYSSIWIIGLAFILAKILQYNYLLKQKKTTDILDYKYFFEEKKLEKSLSFGEQLIAFLRNFARSDVMAFFIMIMSLINLLNIAYWFVGLMFIGMFLLVLVQTIVNYRKMT